MNKPLRELCIEIASMLETGTLTVGVLGLSQNSVDFVMSRVGRDYKRKKRFSIAKKLRGQGKTLEEIGYQLNVTRQRVYQILKK
jgi:DNA-directed RNA polymerase sigma subunit (sigma70/sigma32)